MESKTSSLLVGRLPKEKEIGIAATASPFETGALAAGWRLLESWGFRCKMAAQGLNRKGYLAGEDRSRAGALQALFEDPRIGAIVCVRGGFGSMRMARYLDFERLKNHPTLLIGSSDNSVLLNLVCQRCGFFSLHGPSLTTLTAVDADTRNALKRILQGNPLPVINLKSPQVIQAGRAAGKLAGGNLCVLCHLLGTPLAIDFDDTLLFLEERGEAVYRVDRMLSQMKMAGCFNNVRGVLLGDFIDCGPKDQLMAIFNNIFRDFNIPVITGLPVGHGEQNRPVPIGLHGKINTRPSRLEIGLEIDWAGYPESLSPLVAN